MNIGILGSGSWARALATLVAEAGNHPTIGYRKKPLVGFPGSPNLGAVVRETDLVLVAVPPRAVREVIKAAKLQPANKVLIAARGIEPQTGNWLSEVILQESSAVRIGALGGPALADEVINRRPTAMVAASPFTDLQKLAQKALHSSICRLYTSSDLIGVQLASALVSCLTIALGIADALNQGVGVRGVIVTRGIAEAGRLGKKLGAQENTFHGLAGVGDLVACGSLAKHPGYSAGRELGLGRSIPVPMREEIAALIKLAKAVNVELPITEAVTYIATGKLRPRLAIDMLMRREAKQE